MSKTRWIIICVVIVIAGGLFYLRQNPGLGISQKLLPMIGININASGSDYKSQLANPASMYCVQHSGLLEIIDGSGGQQGLCHLGNGKTCEEWAYMKGECK